MNHGMCDDNIAINEESEKAELSMDSEIHVCSTCNFVGKNRKSLGTHWQWNPDCKRGEFSKMPDGVGNQEFSNGNPNVTPGRTYRCETCNFETKYGFNLTAHYDTIKHKNNTEKLLRNNSEMSGDSMLSRTESLVTKKGDIGSNELESEDNQ